MTTTASACSQGRWRAAKRQSIDERSEGGFVVFDVDDEDDATAGADVDVPGAAAAAAAAAAGRNLSFIVKGKERSASRLMVKIGPHGSSRWAQRHRRVCFKPSFSRCSLSFFELTR